MCELPVADQLKTLSLNKELLISQRSAPLAEEEEFLCKYYVISFQNSFDAEKNPKVSHC